MSCDSCTAIAPFWDEVVARKWPRETFYVNCVYAPSACIARGVGAEAREKRPVYSAPATGPSVQAWNGKVWIRYSGPPNNATTLLNFCLLAVNPTLARATTSTAAGRSAGGGHSTAIRDPDGRLRDPVSAPLSGASRFSDMSLVQLVDDGVRRRDSNLSTVGPSAAQCAVVSRQQVLEAITAGSEFALVRVDPIGCSLPPQGEHCAALDLLPPPHH